MMMTINIMWMLVMVVLVVIFVLWVVIAMMMIMAIISSMFGVDHGDDDGAAAGCDGDAAETW